MIKKNGIEKVPTIEDVWEKSKLTPEKIKQIRTQITICKKADASDEVECGRLLSMCSSMLKGLLERSILLDIYKDITADLYATPNICLIPESMRRMFIFLGTEENDERPALKEKKGKKK